MLPLLGSGERAEVEAFFRDPEPGDDAIRELVELVGRHGGLEHAREQALLAAQRAHRALEGLPEGAVLEALHDSVDYAVERRK